MFLALILAPQRLPPSTDGPCARPAHPGGLRLRSRGDNPGDPHAPAAGFHLLVRLPELQEVGQGGDAIRVLLLV